MTQTNPTQAAIDLCIALGIPDHHAPTIQAAFAEREARNLSDTQRLLWRDELGDICPSLDVCFDGSDRVRCGPCAIEAAKAKGVDPDYTLPNLPEVSRLKRENARLVGALGIVGKVLPSAAGLDDAPDSKIIACYMSMGEMRAIKEALAALKDRTNG